MIAKTSEIVYENPQSLEFDLIHLPYKQRVLFEERFGVKSAFDLPKLYIAVKMHEGKVDAIKKHASDAITIYPLCDSEVESEYKSIKVRAGRMEHGLFTKTEMLYLMEGFNLENAEIDTMLSTSPLCVSINDVVDLFLKEVDKEYSAEDIASIKHYISKINRVSVGENKASIAGAVRQ